MSHEKQKRWNGTGETISLLKDDDSLEVVLGSLVYISEGYLFSSDPI